MGYRHVVRTGRLDQRYAAVLVVVLALAVFLLTWTGIRQSRADSFKLLVLQGKAFTEALAKAAQNAIVSESFYEYLVHRRYADIVLSLGDPDVHALNSQQLAQTAQTYDLYGVFVFSADTNLVAGVVIGGPQPTLPDFVLQEVAQLQTNPEEKYVLLLERGERPAEAIHYYLEITNRLDRVIVIMDNALYYEIALEQTQIGYLAQELAREQGVEYVMYQSTEGIVFSSRATGQLLAIESDPFLSAALEADSIMHRVYKFQDAQVLELVRPFATRKYPFGLLRVGLSLSGFLAVSRGFDRQMVALAAALFVLSSVVVLYLNVRQKRRDLALKYDKIKSVTDRIFEEMRTGVAAVDADGTLSIANEAFQQTFGIDTGIGRRWDDIIRVPELAFQRLISTGESSTEREVSVSVRGDSKSLLVATSRLHPSENLPGGLVVVVYDVTRLKEYEQQAARRERLSEMGDLAAGVAHEIRNPLNAISIAAQRLATEFAGGEKSDEYRAMTDRIRSETKRLNEIITRFLALTREQKDQKPEIDLSRLLAETVNFVRPEAESQGITVSVAVEPDLHVLGDTDVLKQVIMNLFNNAREAVAGQAGHVTVEAHTAANGVVISFSDNGTGIPENIRHKIFSPYFTTKRAGTGLGLTIVHKSVTDLGGEIRVEDSDFGGARFVITFPYPGRVTARLTEDA
ncbi:MAG TPA: ATP-binding protein [Candidatus Deferrimicrobium sp.]|nr:ATP-binding protein [Candidatus Deferrimicrobium sp.]